MAVFWWLWIAVEVNVIMGAEMGSLVVDAVVVDVITGLPSCSCGSIHMDAMTVDAHVK